MKSRKSDQPHRKSMVKQSTRQAIRGTLRIENLEARQLLAGDLVPWEDGLYYPDVGFRAADYIAGVSARDYLFRNAETRNGGSGSSSGNGEDATNGSSTNVSELEPNNGFSQAQKLPLGATGGNFPIVNVAGSIGTQTAGRFDEDWYQVDLKGGDILDVELNSSPTALPFDVTLLDASRVEIGGRRTPQNPSYPATSPLSIGGASSFAVVIPEDGSYFIRVADGDTNYSLNLEVYRPELEKQPLGTRQIVFVDFDGALIRSEIFGLPLGSVRLSPMTSYFGAAGLQPSDEEPLVRSILAGIEENFQGTIPDAAENGWYSSDGTPGHFDIQFINSFDNPDFDPSAHPNVTHLIIGGDTLEFPLPVRGIADSVDIGNFDTTGTAIVLAEVFLSPTLAGTGNANLDWVGTVPISSGVTLRDAYAVGISNTASHELGHSFGAWHQNNANAVLALMDSGGLPIGPTRLGVGPDGIFGTADDIDIDFGVDQYAPLEGNIGIEDTAANMAFALSTGKGDSAFVTGNVFQDRNVNRVLDSADAPLSGVRVYADADNDGRYDVGEFMTFSDALGNYRLSVPAGQHVIRESVPTGFRISTPVNNAIMVTLAAGATRAGQNFGNELLNLTVNGVKYNDVNGNGVKDIGESPIEGVWIYLDLDGDNRIDAGEPAAQTAANGTYNIAFPGPGTYAVREVIPPGFVQTAPGISDDGDPSNDFEHTVVLTGDPMLDMIASSGLDFGNRLTIDFGDAPESYGVASHGFADELILGALWDAEESSLFSANATGDDSNNLDDEDGVILARPLVAGSTNNRVSVTAVNTTGGPAYLHGWLDYDHDGTFTSSEKVISNQLLGTGTNSVTFAAPANAMLGNTVARFRYSSEQNMAPTGPASNGEVEDYVFSVVATLQIANDDQFTVARSSVLNELDVLANDFNLPGESLTIVNTSGSSAGAVIQVNAARNRILYTPPAAFIGQDVFTYTVRNSGGDFDEATVVIDVDLFFENPLAIDDSYDLPTNSVDFPINVLANDIEGQNGALTIVSAMQPDKGGRVTISTGGKSIRYTPARDFGGTEFFTYTVADAGGNQSTAQVTLHTLPGDRADDDVLIQLVATDLSGNPITAIEQGQEFVIQVVVDDLRFDSTNPGVAAGVFSAYADLLYNRQLVSTAAPDDPTSGFNFDVTFFNDYFNFQNGDASVPGIINEFGAFNVRQVMNDPNPLVLAAITFVATSPGLADFMPDPADAAPPNDTLLFDTPGSAVPDERIRYLGTSLEIVGDGVEFPVAVDDSVPGAIPAGSFGFPINVLANDRPGSTGQIRLNSVTDGTSGITQIDTRGTSDPSDDRVLYTPNGGFNGSDQFTYTIQDARGIQSTATVTLRVGSADADDQVGLRLSATDLSGNPIDSITVGGQFQLRGYVQDLRGFGADRGVFAAYEDVLYSSTLVSPIPSQTNDPNLGFQVEFGPNYQEVFSGDIRTPGLINEIGAVQSGQTPLGLEEQLLFVITMTANSVGTANFIGDPADISPLHDTLTFEPPAAVDFGQIRYGFDSLNIVSAGGSGNGEGYYHNSGNQFDVNNDGYVSPIDALGVINSLNSGGSRSLPRGGGEGEDGGHLFVDVNADGSLSPIDALLVINRLNTRGQGEGEGEWVAEGGLIAEGEYSAAGSVAALSPGVVATSNTSKDSPNDVSSLSSQERLMPRKIGIRPTESSYGPARDDLFAAFGGEERSAENMEDLLEQIAPDIEETWKDRFQL